MHKIQLGDDSAWIAVKKCHSRFFLKELALVYPEISKFTAENVFLVHTIQKLTHTGDWWNSKLADEKDKRQKIVYSYSNISL
jgi:hypothetical protein